MQTLLEELILEHLGTSIAGLHLANHHVSKIHLDNLRLENQKEPCCKSEKDNPGLRELHTEHRHSALLQVHVLQNLICFAE